jgi:hypothetical protein
MLPVTRNFCLALAMFVLVALALVIVHALPRPDWAAIMSIVVVFAPLVLLFSVLFLCELHGESLVKKWAGANHYRIIELRRLFRRRLPGSWGTGKLYYGVFRIIVEDGAGKAASCWDWVSCPVAWVLGHLGRGNTGRLRWPGEHVTVRTIARFVMTAVKPTSEKARGSLQRCGRCQRLQEELDLLALARSEPEKCQRRDQSFSAVVGHGLGNRVRSTIVQIGR